MALGTRPLSLHQLHAAAVYLGISLRTHPQLLWVASAALCSEKPLGWLEGLAADGAPFYYHPTLGCAQHEHPAFCYWRAVAIFLREAR